MALRAPNTIFLSGVPDTIIGDLATLSAATPGMLAEMVDSSGVNAWQPNSSATNQPTLAVYLDNPEWNQTIDDAYAANDIAKVAFLEPGDVFYGLIPSGQNISNSELLQSNGDGKLKSATAATADANVARFQALDNIGAVTVDTRCRVCVIC